MMTETESALLQSGLGLALVLGLLLLAAWAFRHWRPGRRTAPVTLDVLGQVAVGPKEKVVIVSVDGDWLVLGVAPGRVNLLALGEPGAQEARDTLAAQDRPLGPLDTIERSAAFREAFGVAKARGRSRQPAAGTCSG